MKYQALFLALIWFIISCGSKKNSNLTETEIVADSIQHVIAPTIEEPVKEDSIKEKQTGFHLTSEGVGEISIGRSVNHLPASIKGLYTDWEHGSSTDALTITFIDNDGPSFIAYDFGEAQIDVIDIIGKNIYVKTPNGNLKLGDSFNKVTTLPGVQREWVNTDNSGIWFWVWDDLWFGPSQDLLTEEVARNLYNHDATFDNIRFPDKIKIGFIGTGIPF